MYFHSNLKTLRKRKGLTQEDLSAELKVKRSTLNNYENKISQPTLDIQLSVSDYFGISVDILLKVDLCNFTEFQFEELEKGSDIYTKGTNLRVLTSTVGNDNEENIELVPVKAKAGYMSGYADPEYVSSLPIYRLPFLKNDRKYRTFQISGDSMLPIPDGTWVTGEYIQDWTSIKTGEACIVLTREDGLVFKIVENLLIEIGVLRLSSLNPLYQPFDVKGQDIFEVWKFVHYTTDHLPEGNISLEQLMMSVQQLIHDVEEIKKKLK
ncbi:MAG: XRE family transcriptional regulator [Tenuifilaceae bacterium]